MWAVDANPRELVVLCLASRGALLPRAHPRAADQGRELPAAVLGLGRVEPPHASGRVTNPNDATNPLFNATRTKSPTDQIPASWVDDDVTEGILTLGTFAEFGGTATASGSLEGTPHGPVHGWVGGDMGAFSTAGKDPVFFAHHSNIDKLWSDWHRLDSQHMDPTDPAFLNLTFTFFDENKVWRSIRPRRCSTTRTGSATRMGRRRSSNG